MNSTRNLIMRAPTGYFASIFAFAKQDRLNNIRPILQSGRFLDIPGNSFPDQSTQRNHLLTAKNQPFWLPMTNPWDDPGLGIGYQGFIGFFDRAVTILEPLDLEDVLAVEPEICIRRLDAFRCVALDTQELDTELGQVRD